jgi:4-amino-4-deoxy-L-arabinose transferase-like glycosyltransferase
LSGLIFGIATLVKPQTILFPIGAVIALGLVFRHYRWQMVLKSGLIVYIGLLAVVLPWSARNLNVLGEFVLVSTNGGTALPLGANEQMTGDHFDYQHTPVFSNLGIPWEDRVKRQVELNHKQKEAARNWISNNKLTYVAWMPMKVIKLWIKDTDAFWSYDKSYPDSGAIVRAAQIVNQVFYTCLLGMALVSAVVALRAIFTREDEMTLGLLFCMPVFVSLLAAIFTGQIRYHFPAMPYILVASAWMVVNAGRINWINSILRRGNRKYA